MLILLLLLELWWFRWWRLLATLAVPTLFPMCKICGCPLRLFVIVFVCCCKVEPIAAARAVSSPVVLVVQTDITHELRTHFEYSLFVWLTHIHTTNHRHTHKLARVTHKNKLAKMPIDFAFFFSIKFTIIYKMMITAIDYDVYTKRVQSTQQSTCTLNEIYLLFAQINYLSGTFFYLF